MPSFRADVLIPGPPEALARWHLGPAALERLLPPWAGVRVLTPGAVAEGSEVRLSVPVGPLRRTWVARHREVGPGGFTDAQVAGPFRSWVHRHTWTAAPGTLAASVLVDDITWSLGALTPLARGLVERDLARVFRWRHRRTREDLQRLAACGGPPRRIAVTGASGLVGSALVPFLRQAGHTVVPMVRRAGGGIAWDPERGTIDADALRACDAVVHLAGATVAQRWSPRAQREIRDSRILGTGLIARTLAEDPGRVRVVVAASGVAGAAGTGDRPATEADAGAPGFLAEVVRAWEAAADPLRSAGIRTVHLRTGVVLSAAGGALAAMLPAFRLGLGGPVGDGRQWLPWIGLDDLVGAYAQAVVDPAWTGPMHAVAGCLRQGDFARTLGRVLRRPAWVPLPAVAVRTALGAMGRELLLDSLNVQGHPLVLPLASDLEDCLRLELGLLGPQGA